MFKFYYKKSNPIRIYWNFKHKIPIRSLAGKEKVCKLSTATEKIISTNPPTATQPKTLPLG